MLRWIDESNEISIDIYEHVSEHLFDKKMS
jgi:hypothetical protein